MVLALESLEFFLLQNYAAQVEALITKGELYKELNKARALRFEDVYAVRLNKAVGNQGKHEESQRFLASLEHDLPFVTAYLKENNDFELPSQQGSRTLVLLDGTGSMTGLLDKCKAKLAEIFACAKAVLLDKKVPNKAFAMQIAVYRNYNAEPEDFLLQSSGWETESAQLSPHS
jgi:hypothetical protein